MRFWSKKATTSPQPGPVAMIAAVAALGFMLADVALLLGLTGGLWQSRWVRLALLTLIFLINAAVNASWARLPLRHRVLAALIILTLGVVFPLWAPDTLPAVMEQAAAIWNDTVSWSRSFWYGIADAPPAATGWFLFSGVAWLMSSRLWRVAAGRSPWVPHLIIGSLPALILWLYDYPREAILSNVGFFASMLILAATTSAPSPDQRTGYMAGCPPKQELWTRVAAAVVLLAIITPTALALPAQTANPWPAVHEKIQRIFPMSARGSKSGFGDYSQATTDIPTLPLGGPFRPSPIDLLEISVSAAGENRLPPLLYLRGTVYVDYNGNSFTGTRSTRLPRSALRQRRADVPQQLLEQRIRLLHLSTTVLYGAENPQRIILPADKKVVRDREGSLRVLQGLSSGDVYEVQSLLALPDDAYMRQNTGSWDDLQSTATAHRYLAIPDTVPQRVWDLAREITGNATTPYQAARQIVNYLRRYPYQADTPFTPPGRDFVDYFLFDLQSGYCVYYASAAVILLRAAGIPARLVEGLIVPLQGEGTYRVSARNAHTWVEAFLPGYGWYSLEPTPPDFAGNLLPDAVANADHSAVVNEALVDYTYEMELPPYLLEDLPDEGNLVAPPALDELPDTSFSVSPWRWERTARHISLALVISTAAWSLIVAYRHFRRRQRGKNDPALAVADIYENYRRLVLGMAARDTRPQAKELIQRQVSLTPGELAGTVAELWPRLAVPVQTLTAAYNEIAYGQRQYLSAANNIGQIMDANRRLLAALKQILGPARYFWIRLLSLVS